MRSILFFSTSPYVSDRWVNRIPYYVLRSQMNRLLLTLFLSLSPRVSLFPSRANLHIQIDLTKCSIIDTRVNYLISVFSTSFFFLLALLLVLHFPSFFVRMHSVESIFFCFSRHYLHRSIVCFTRTLSTRRVFNAR